MIYIWQYFPFLPGEKQHIIYCVPLLFSLNSVSWRSSYISNQSFSSLLFMTAPNFIAWLYFSSFNLFFTQQTHRFFCFVLLHITPQWMTYVNIILVTECAKPHLCISCQNSWNPILCPGALNSLCHLGNQTSLIPASISPALNLSTGHGLSKISVLIFPLVWGWFFLALTALPGPRCCETPEEPSTLPPLPHFLPEEFEEVIPQFIWSFPDCYFAWMVLLFIMKISNSRKE